MRKSWGLWVVSVLLVSLLAGAPAGYCEEKKDEAPAAPVVHKVGDAFPEMTVKGALGAGDIALGKAYFSKSKLTAVVFFNAGCLACRSELELMSAAKKQFGKDMNVLAVSVDMGGDGVVKGYQERYKFDATYALDPEFQVAPKFGFAFTPAMLLVDGSGKIVAAKSGYNPNTDRDALVKMVKDQLK